MLSVMVLNPQGIKLDNAEVTMITSTTVELDAETS
ncbi:hypothetical protein AAUPMC_10353, partial [Pasteurella multocida subsp. multocida str. Anand1_cattle]